MVLSLGRGKHELALQIRWLFLIKLLVTESEEQILNTIKSRCQSLYFPPLSEEDIAIALISKEGASESEAVKIAHEVGGICAQQVTYESVEAFSEDHLE